MNRQWMYLADRRSKQWVDGMHAFLDVAEANKLPSGAMFCPCGQCENRRTYKSRGILHFHLMSSGFMQNYTVWSKHGERGVIMDDNEEEDDDNDIPTFGEYGAFAEADMEDVVQ